MGSAEIITTGEDYEMSNKPFNILFGEDATISDFSIWDKFSLKKHIQLYNNGDGLFYT